ncbi:MAG: hypothetical protein AAF432_02175 [Planctomycetota bacterium]
MTDTSSQPESSTVDGRYCGFCGYALKGMSADQKCPECGVPVQVTLDGNLIWHVPESYRRRLRIGLWMLVIACAELTLLKLSRFLFVLTVRDADTVVLGETYTMIVSMAEWLGFMLQLIAVLIITAPWPYHRSINRWKPKSRFWLRALIITTSAYSILNFILWFQGRLRLVAEALWSNTIMQYVITAAHAATTIFLFLFLAYLLRLLGKKHWVAPVILVGCGFAIVAFCFHNFIGFRMFSWADFWKYFALGEAQTLLRALVLGALAERLAHMLREKNNPTSTPNADV